MKNFLAQFTSRIFTVLVILALTFVFLHLIPGGPFDSERGLPPAIEQNLYQKYGLHKKGEDPLLIWILKDLKSFAAQLVSLRLGPSLKYEDRDVNEIIMQALPYSVTLGGTSLSAAFLAALLTALGLAFFKSAGLENLFSFLSSLTIALPSFIRAIILISLFAMLIRIFPPALWQGPESVVLPVLALAITPYFLMTELLYTELVKERKKLYVTTAMAKGLSPMRILVKHMLKNSLNPLLALLGPMATYLLTGSFVVETIFSIPGLGRHFVLSVIDRDYFLVMGITAVIATTLILFNWFTDAVSKTLDPRLAS